MFDGDLWWVKSAAYAVFAALGGLVGHVMRNIESGKKIHVGKAIAEGVAAGFVGLIVLFACQAMGLTEQWTGVIVGVSGWLGASASIKIIEKMVFKKLGITKTEDAH
jgi:hypothetical protein